MTEQINKMFEELINLGKETIKEAKQKTEEFTKQKSLKELLNNSKKINLRKINGIYSSKEEMLEKAKQIFKEAEIEDDKLYILTKENDVYEFLIYHNGVDDKLFRIVGGEKIEL